MAVNNVCRLCLSDEELFWVFDQSLVCPGNMKDIIFITTGVEITEKDIISQKICMNCFQLTVTMFKFRERAERTDRYLQDKCKELLMSCDMSKKAPNTQTGNEDIIEQTEVVTPTITGSSMRILSNVEIKFSPKDTEPVVEDIAKLSRKKIHQSVDSIFATYADIKLPSACLRLDLNPTVCMKMYEVEEYFCSKNLDMGKAVQTGLKSSRAAINKNPLNKDGRVPDTSKEEVRVITSIAMAGTSREEDKDKSQIEVKRKIEDCGNEILKPATNNEIKENIDSQKVSPKRRRLSSSDPTSEPAPTLMDILRLKPIENLSVHRCTICQAPYTSSRALKKHSREHFKCQYCRTRFRILERKEKHLETCIVKHALNTKICIKLQRIDYPSKKIHEASSTDDTREDENNQDRGGVVFEETDKSTSKEDTRTVQDIIELSDDEQDNLPSTSSVESLIPTAPSLVSVEKIQSSICSSNGIVKPALEIKNNTLLDSIDTTKTDIRLFRELLDQMMPVNLKLSVTCSSQTELPPSGQIIANASNNTAELKGLLPQLYVFKIPVDINKGDFKVTYTENKVQEKRKVICWDILRAIEIKAPNGSSFTEVNLNKRISMGSSLLRSAERLSQVMARPKILNTAFATNMSRQSGTGHSSDVIPNPNQNLQSARTQKTSHRLNQSINPQSAQLSSLHPQRTTQLNQYLAWKTLQNQKMQLSHSVLQNVDKNSSRRISPEVLQSLKPLRVQQNLKPPRIQQNLNSNLIQVVPQTMNQSTFQVPHNVVFTTNGSTASAYYVQSVAAVPELVAPDVSGLSYATQRAVASSSNVTSTNIPANLDISMGNTFPPHTVALTVLPPYGDVNSSVTNTEMVHVNVSKDRSLPEKNAVYAHSNSISVDTSVATSGSNDSTAGTRPMIRVKNLCDLK